MNDIEANVVNLVAKHLDKDPSDVKLESKFSEDLGTDSLDQVELIMAFEETFELEIPDSSAEKITKVKDVVDYIIENQSVSD